MTGQKSIICIHAEREVCDLLDGGIDVFTITVEIGFGVSDDFGVYLNAVKEIFKSRVILEVVKFSRNAADKEIRFIAVGSGYPNV